MPSYRTGEVVTLLESRRGLQRVEVELGQGPERAYALSQLTGPVAIGDRVVVNTTAVELGLGTGGWHVVHWNLARGHWSEPGPGHIIKGRYTSLQADVGSTEEHLEALAEVDSIDGMPVVVAALHSQLPAVAAAFKARAPGATLAYVMTDGAGLPLALSDLVATLCATGPARRHHHVWARVRGRLRGGVGLLRARGGAPRRARRRHRRRDGSGHRGYEHPARLQRHGGRADPRRRQRPRRGPDRVSPGLVRRRARPPRRALAPQRDRAAHRRTRPRAHRGAASR